MTLRRDHTQPVQQAAATAQADAAKTGGEVQPVVANVQAEARLRTLVEGGENLRRLPSTENCARTSRRRASLYGLEATSYRTGNEIGEDAHFN